VTARTAQRTAVKAAASSAKGADAAAEGASGSVAGAARAADDGGAAPPKTSENTRASSDSDPRAKYRNLDPPVNPEDMRAGTVQRVHEPVEKHEPGTLMGPRPTGWRYPAYVFMRISQFVFRVGGDI